MPKIRWSAWTKVGDDGAIPDNLLPATMWQHKWMIHHEFDLSNWMEAGQGTIRMEWRTGFGPHVIVDKAPFSFTSIRDFMDPTVAQYTYWMQNGTQEKTAGTATRMGGDSTGQLVFWATGPTWEFAVSDGFFHGELTGDVWVGRIEGGTKIDFQKWYPNRYIPKGKQLWIRTVGGGRQMQTVLDPVTHNTHEFWIEGGVLYSRRQLRLTGGHDGLVTGGALQISGENLLIGAGTVTLGQRTLAFGPLIVALRTGTSRICLHLSSAGSDVVSASLQQGAEELPAWHTVIGEVAGQTLTRARNEMGTLIAVDAEAFSAWIEDDGSLRVNVLSEQTTRQYESRDRGANWRLVGQA